MTILKVIEKNYEEYRFDDSIFKQRCNLDAAVEIILEINEVLNIR